MGKAHGSESDTDEGAGPSKQSKATGNKANGNWGARAVTSGQDGKAKRSSKDTWKRYMGCAGVWHGHKCPAAPRGASKSADHRYDGIRVACPTQMQVLPTYRHSRNPCELRDKCLEAYLRPSLDLVAGTVTATVRVFLSNKNAYIHPFEDRTTTARELAGLQVRSWLSSKHLMSWSCHACMQALIHMSYGRWQIYSACLRASQCTICNKHRALPAVNSSIATTALWQRSQ